MIVVAGGAFSSPIRLVRTERGFRGADSAGGLFPFCLRGSFDQFINQTGMFVLKMVVIIPRGVGTSSDALVQLASI